MPSIADIYASVRLKLDGSGFEDEATEAGSKAGDSVGASMAKSLGSYLKTAAPTAIGAGLGLALGSAAAGAVELDTAIRQLQASTGLTGEAAVDAGKSLSGMAKDNLADFDTIGEVMAKVHNDLGLTGAAADAATQQFLTFAVATGQDAAEAVAAFDDILDGWNLTAADAGGLMDQLVASTQTYGGTVPQMETALARLAPILQGMNVSVDEGIGLLNLFNASGVDATGMSEALATAMKKLKPGESLNTLLAQLAAIPDQSARTQKAIELFGSVAGPKLAQAIKPGRDSLDDFVLTTDQVIGKSKEAADVIEDSFTNRAALAFKGFQVSLAEFGLNFGDLLLPAAMFGPRWVKAAGATLGGALGMVIGKLGPKAAELLTALWWATAKDTVILGAAEGAGAQAGLSYAAGFLSKIIPVIGIGLATQGDVAAGTDDLMTRLGEQSGGKFGYGWGEGAGEGAAAALTDADLASLVATEYATTLDREMATLGAGIPAGVAQGVEAGTPEVRRTVGEMLGPLPPPGWKPAATNAGRAIPESVAAGVLEAQNVVPDALNVLKNLMKNALTPTAQIARDIGILTSEALAKGLRDKRPVVRQEAQRVQALAEQDLADLIAGGGRVGKDAAAELAKKLRSKDPAVRASAQHVKDLVDGKLDGIVDNAGQTGTNAAAALSRNLQNGLKALNVRWSGKVQVLTAKGLAGGGPAVAGVPYWVNENTPRSELFVPSTSGRVLTHEDAMRAASAGGGSTTINVPITGYVRAESPSEIVTRIRQVAASGLLTNPRRLHRVEVRHA